MATTFPTYPATTFEQAVELAIFSSNQLHNVINEDATTTIETETGYIPTLRKALVDNFYFKTPVEWVGGTTVTVFNQLYNYSSEDSAISGLYYAPSATTVNPVSMGATPEGDANFALYSASVNVKPLPFEVDLVVSAYGRLYYYTDSDGVTSTFSYIGTLIPYTTTSDNPAEDQGGIWSPTNTTGIWLEVGAANIYELITSPDGERYIGMAATIDDLRGIEPSFANQKIWLKEYASGTGHGWGYFIYDSSDTSTADDGGYAIVTTNGARWKRALPKNELDITHFGAVPYDGTSATDCATAFGRMYAWSQIQDDNSKNIGVQFPAGSFAISTFKTTTYARRVRIAGKNPMTFGYFCPTKLTLIGAADSWAITVNARMLDFTGIEIYGQYDSDGVVRNFLKNTTVAGQYFHAIGWVATYMGGKTFSLLDTLDTKFSEFYTSYTYDSAIYAIMSGTSSGSWDHITAVELSNFNIQYHQGDETGKDAIYLPRAGQSVCYNGWIEHSRFPGNLSEGTWAITQLSLEDNDEPVYVQYSKTVETNININGSKGLDHTSGAVGSINGVTRPSWVTSAYEQGYLRLDSRGIEAHGSLAYSYINSFNRFSNMESATAWCHIGSIRFPDTGASCVLRLIGTGGYNSATENPNPSSTGYGSGEAFIRVQHKGSTDRSPVSWHGEGSCPITAVKYTNTYASSVDIYVQVRQYTYAIAAMVDSDSTSRYQAGTHFLWNPDMSAVDDITSISTKDANATLSFSNGEYGFGMGFNNGIFALDTPTTSAAGTTTIPVQVNGNDLYVTVTGSPGRIRLQRYTFDTLPSVDSGDAGVIVWCTGTAGTPSAQMIIWTGAAWKYVGDPSTTVTKAGTTT